MHSDETRIYIALLITATILAIILTFFIISLVRQHKKNLQLHKEKIQAEINTLENERKRIAADLHDEIGPVLSAVKLQITAIESKDDRDQALISGAGHHIDDMLAKIREIANNLMPTALSRKGLLIAISEFADSINYLEQIKIDYDFKIETLKISKECEIHLYRVVQEIVHNSMKHAHASRIKIEIEEAKDMVRLNLRDNGKGFNYPAVLTRSNGFGLKNILSRVEIMNGNIFLDSEENKGVNYIIEIPVSKTKL